MQRKSSQILCKGYNIVNGYIKVTTLVTRKIGKRNVPTNLMDLLHNLLGRLFNEKTSCAILPTASNLTKKNDNS